MIIPASPIPGPPRSTILPPPWGSTPRTTSANGHTNDTANSAASVGADTKKGQWLKQENVLSDVY